MKKALAIFFFFITLLASAQATQYWPIVFNAKGLNLNDQPSLCDPDQFIKLDNYQLGIDRFSTERLGIITKTVTRETLFTLPVSGYCRGLHVIYNCQYALMHITTTETIGDDGRWYSWSLINGVQLITTETNSYPSVFTLYEDTYKYPTSPVYKSFFTRLNYPSKHLWSYSITTAETTKICGVSDTGATPTALTGTLYFTSGSTLVTGSATSFLTEAYKGKLIRKTSSDIWHEVEYATSNTILNLMSNFADATGSSATAQVAPQIGFTAAHIYYWKNRMWIYGEWGGDSASKKRLRCSFAATTATPFGVETWTGSDAGYLDVPSRAGGGVDGYASGIVGIGDYLLCFDNNSYVVYRYNYTVVPPVEEVKRFSTGACSPLAITPVEDMVFYFTGNEVRATNGFNDIPISGPIDNYFKYNSVSYSYYYGLCSAANPFNWSSAYYNAAEKTYHLILSTGIEFVYDVGKKIWIGNANIPAGKYVLTEAAYTNYPALISCDTSKGNKVYRSSSSYYEDLATGEVISADIMFGEPKRKKRISGVELLVHVGATRTTTCEFSYYTDGTFGSTNTITVSNSGVGTNYYKKVFFPLNVECMYFRWRFRDIATNSGTGRTSLIGGNIYYDILQ